MLSPEEQETFLNYLLNSLEEGEVVTSFLVACRRNDFDLMRLNSTNSESVSPNGVYFPSSFVDEKTSIKSFTCKDSPIIAWVTPCQRYTLRIAAEAWRQIDRECHRSDLVETGGILIGYYTKDESTAVITEALPPSKDSVQGRNQFHRGVNGLRETLIKRWEDKFRTYYVGEWHYHPTATVEPSDNDLVQMRDISVEPQWRCKEPIMVIVGQQNPRDKKRPVRAFVFPQEQEHSEFRQRREKSLREVEGVFEGN